jgi:uncharacterized repeat protein (TIGR01451 family)
MTSSLPTTTFGARNTFEEVPNILNGVSNLPLGVPNIFDAGLNTHDGVSNTLLGVQSLSPPLRNPLLALTKHLISKAMKTMHDFPTQRSAFMAPLISCLWSGDAPVSKLSLRQKRLRSLSRAFFALSLLIPTAQAAPFTPGNLVIYRVGDGTAALSNTGAPVFLDEYSPSGFLIQSLPLPKEPSGANRRLVASGTATSEGLLTRSSDGRFLMATGYDAAIPHGISLPTTDSVTVPRTIGRIDYLSNSDTSTRLTDFADLGSPRSAISVDGSSFWMAGSTGGLRHAALASTGSSTLVSATSVNLRNLAIFENQLYVTSALLAGSYRVGSVGTGLPTGSGVSTIGLPGLPIIGSPHGIFLADLSSGVAGADTLYVADDGLGLLKYSKVAGTWTLNSTIGSGSDNFRGLAGAVNGTEVTLHATGMGGSTGSGGGTLVRIFDASGYNAAFSGVTTPLASADSDRAFRGVAFAPLSGLATPSDLAVEITAPAVAASGIGFDYTLIARNQGATHANGVNLEFTLPSGTSFVSAVTSGNFVRDPVIQSSVVKFTAGSLPPGASAVITVKVTSVVGTIALSPSAARMDASNSIAELDELNNGSLQTPVTVVTAAQAPSIITYRLPNRTIASGTTANLDLAVIGNPAPSFQWYRGTSGDTTDPILGANSRRFAMPLLTVSESYWARATNELGSVDSNSATITVVPPEKLWTSTFSFTAGSLVPSLSTNAQAAGITVSNLSTGTMGDLFDNGGTGSALRISGNDTDNELSAALSNGRYLAFTATIPSSISVDLVSLGCLITGTNLSTLSNARIYTYRQGFDNPVADNIGILGVGPPAAPPGSFDVPTCRVQQALSGDLSWNQEPGGNVGASDHMALSNTTITFVLPWTDNSDSIASYVDLDTLQVVGLLNDGIAPSITTQPASQTIHQRGHRHAHCHGHRDGAFHLPMVSRCQRRHFDSSRHQLRKFHLACPYRHHSLLGPNSELG